MYHAILYRPDHEARILSSDEVARLDIEQTITLHADLEPIGEILGVRPGMVDILDCDKNYAAYIVHNHVYDRNQSAEVACNELAREEWFGGKEELSHLYGPVLVISTRRPQELAAA